jgi:hypothetical protein
MELGKMTRILPPPLETFLKDAAAYTLCTLLSVMLSCYGNYPILRLLQEYFGVLFLTPCGWIILYEAALQPIHKLVKSQRRG